HAMAAASVQYCFKKTAPKSIVLAASMSTIVSSELFDFDVILIFNSFDEGHDGFRCLTFLFQEVYPSVP
ncbi:hypothetical protein Tco_1039830, partial [Tanacetum coccineum]